jgi:dTDP-4-dehydrorhamnose reductase
MNQASKVLIFGSNGFLGTYLEQSLKEAQNAFFASRQDENSFAVRNFQGEILKGELTEVGIQRVVLLLQPTVIINCAALANVELCEKNPKLAITANSEFPKYLAKASTLINCKLIHISSDAVFGQPGKKFKVSDTPMPRSIYGFTKLEGENNVLIHAPKSLVVRTNFFGYHPIRPTLLNYFYKKFSKGEHVYGYTNVVFNPVYVVDLANALLELADSNCEGITHFVGNEEITKYEFALRILNKMGLPRNLLDKQELPLDPEFGIGKNNLTLENSVNELLINNRYDIDKAIGDSLSRSGKAFYVN